MKCINIKNFYNISNEKIKKICEIVDYYTEHILQEKFDKLTLHDALGILEILVEFIPIASNREVIVDKCYELLNCINNNFISKRLYFGSSLFDGLSNIGRIVSRLYENTSYFLQVKQRIDTEILRQTLELSSLSIKYQENLRTECFDLMKGVSGCVSYIIQYMDKQDITVPLEFLMSISKKRNFNGIEVPGWFIKPENITVKDYLEMYNEGYINYSLSHGIGGVFATLDLAYRNGYEHNKIKDVIKDIFNEYVNISEMTSVNLQTGIINFREYGVKKVQSYKERQSWCYGSASILYHMIQAANALNDEFMIRTSSRMLVNIHNGHLGLFSPVICHGYSGTMTVFRKLFMYLNDSDFEKIMLILLDKTLNSFDYKYKYGFVDTIYKPINGKINKTIEEKQDFLTGTSGIILALMAFVTETKFEKALLLD